METTLLKDKVAFITGVASPNGMGFATAKALAQWGASLGILDISDRVFDREKDLRKSGVSVKAYKADLQDKVVINEIANDMLSFYGKVDILANVAGMAYFGTEEIFKDVVSLSEEEWDFSIGINLKSSFNTIQAFLPGMIKREYGKIVNVSSVTGPLVANPGESPYCAAKAAVVGLTRALALEVGKQNITVNAVAPGWIKTGASTEGELAGGINTGMGRPGTPDEVANLIRFLSSDDSSYITGQLIVIDGGNIIQEYKGPSELYY
ncbi:MAG TPA: SDR family NAD(P)-dependent oxidoreductase [Anaerovoracaceae bacterium]|nr:SDR family NAD(P)-dependent oxidoreductase [Anaerovoracaceae bacterium]